MRVCVGVCVCVCVWDECVCGGGWGGEGGYGRVRVDAGLVVAVYDIKTTAVCEGILARHSQRAACEMLSRVCVSNTNAWT